VSAGAPTQRLNVMFELLDHAVHREKRLCPLTRLQSQPPANGRQLQRRQFVAETETRLMVCFSAPPMLSELARYRRSNLGERITQ
jgi:hypothetical protein